MCIRDSLLSDQTSCHNVYDGGYCPVGISFEERTRLLAEDKETFHRLVDETLARHFAVIKDLTAKGTYFFDYGNAFMKSVYDSGIKEISKNGLDDKDGFIWPSYVEDIMGPMLFDYGYEMCIRDRSTAIILAVGALTKSAESVSRTPRTSE